MTGGRTSLGRMSRFIGRVRLDFDKDDRFTTLVDGDQIDFARLVRFALSHDDQALAAQQPCGRLFTPLAHRSAGIDSAVSPIDVVLAYSIQDAAHRWCPTRITFGGAL